MEPGQPVAFSAQAADSTSGLAPGGVEWTWADGTATHRGDAATHSFSAPGTYVVRAKVSDVAGNAAEAATTVTVKAPAAGGGAGGGGGGAGGGESAGGRPSASPSPTAAAVSQAAGGGGAQVRELGGLGVTAPKRFRLDGKRRSVLIGVTTGRPGRLALKLTRGRRTGAKATSTVAAGGAGRRLKLARGMRPGKYTLSVSFTPRGASGAVTIKLRIIFVKPARKRARATTSVPRSSRRAVSAAGLPAPSLPDGRLDGAPGGRVFAVR